MTKGNRKMSLPAGNSPPGSASDAESGRDSSGAGNTAARQALWWLCLVGVLFLLIYQVGVEGTVSIAVAFLGLCFVIFIHELGHFAVAKWCDVHVEAFSIGFGPAVPGCSFRRGETIYKLAWFPLGGYVKMVGEGNETDDDDADPRAFKNKSVLARMAIFSAGVFMNMVFGLVCFIFVYRTHGVDQLPAIVGSVDPSGAAWQEGVRSGSVVKQIGGSKNPFFDDLRYEVILNSKAGEKLKLVYEVPGDPKGVQEIFLEPRRDPGSPYPIIGVGNWPQMRLAEFPGRKAYPPVYFGSPAATAEPPFKPGDWIVGMSDPDHAGEVTLLPKDPRNQTADHPDYLAYRQRLRRQMEKAITFRVSRKEDGVDKTVDIPVGPAYHYSLGLRMRMGQIAAVRDNSPASKARAQTGNETGIRAQDLAKAVEGDILDQVEVTDAKGTKIRWVSSRAGEPTVPGVVVKDLDPVRLPDELEDWADSVQGPRKVALTVLRNVGHVERQKVHLDTEWDDNWKDDYVVATSMTSPIAIAGLGLAYRIDTMVEGVDGPAAEANVKRGDLIKAIQINNRTSDFGKFTPDKWKDLKPNSWASVAKLIDDIESKDFNLRLERDKQDIEVTLTAKLDKSWPAIERGLILAPEKYLQRADTVSQAISLGIRATLRSVTQIYKNLQAIFTGRVSPEMVGGPLTIATTAYSLAGADIYAFLNFLGIISVNLAVLNFLPIPILDGGHMVFLLYEKLRGAPASENVRAAATYVGLFLILALVVFVWWVDIKRLL